MTKSTLAAFAICLYALGAMHAQAAGDPEKGKALYAVCMACHGPDGGGNKDLGSPRLTGLPAAYIARQLGNFKSGARGADPKDTFGAQMRPMAMTLADDQAVMDVVAFIGTLKSAPPAATIEGDVAAGKTAYATCSACHGADGKGNDALNAPSLVGLPDWYNARQLKAYKDGLRGTDPKDMFGMQMRPMAMTLPDEAAIKNVVAYINTLR